MALIEFFSALNVFDFVFDQYLFMYGKFCCHSAVNSSPRERVILDANLVQLLPWQY